MDLRLWHPVFPTEPCTLQTCSSTNRKTTNSSEITKTMAENCRASLLRVNSYLRKGFSGPLRKMLILIFAFGIWFVLIPVSNWPQSPFLNVLTQSWSHSQVHVRKTVMPSNEGQSHCFDCNRPEDRQNILNVMRSLHRFERLPKKLFPQNANCI